MMGRPLGYVCSAETRSKISESNRVRFANPVFKAEYMASLRDANCIKWNADLDIELIRRRLAGENLADLARGMGFATKTISKRLSELAETLAPKKRGPRTLLSEAGIVYREIWA